MRKIYNSIGKIYCPALNSYVVFNSIGFRHLQYKPDGTARKTKEVIYKLSLIPLIVPVLTKSKKVYSERISKTLVSRKRPFVYRKSVTYSLSANVGKDKRSNIRVIILRIGNGDFVFYSVMKNKKHHP